MRSALALFLLTTSVFAQDGVHRPSREELNEFRNRNVSCWKPFDSLKEGVIRFHLFIDTDGKLFKDPAIVDSDLPPQLRHAPEEIAGRLKDCAPYTIVPGKNVGKVTLPLNFNNSGETRLPTLALEAGVNPYRPTTEDMKAFRDRYLACWRPYDDVKEEVARFRIAIGRDGKLVEEPEILSEPTSAAAKALRSTKR